MTLLTLLYYQASIAQGHPLSVRVSLALRNYKILKSELGCPSYSCPMREKEVTNLSHIPYMLYIHYIGTVHYVIHPYSAKNLNVCHPRYLSSAFGASLFLHFTVDSSANMISFIFIIYLESDHMSLRSCSRRSGPICHPLSSGLLHWPNWSACSHVCLTGVWSQLSSRMILGRHSQVRSPVYWKPSSGFHFTTWSVSSSASLTSSPALLHDSLEGTWSILIWVLCKWKDRLAVLLSGSFLTLW